jgi:hypothetical protein
LTTKDTKNTKALLRAAPSTIGGLHRKSAFGALD